MSIKLFLTCDYLYFQYYLNQKFKSKITDKKPTVLFCQKNNFDDIVGQINTNSLFGADNYYIIREFQLCSQLNLLEKIIPNKTVFAVIEDELIHNFTTYNVTSANSKSKLYSFCKSDQIEIINLVQPSSITSPLNNYRNDSSEALNFLLDHLNLKMESEVNYENFTNHLFGNFDFFDVWKWMQKITYKSNIINEEVSSNYVQGEISTPDILGLEFKILADNISFTEKQMKFQELSKSYSTLEIINYLYNSVYRLYILNLLIKTSRLSFNSLAEKLVSLNVLKNKNQFYPIHSGYLKIISSNNITNFNRYMLGILNHLFIFSCQIKSSNLKEKLLINQFLLNISND